MLINCYEVLCLPPETTDQKRIRTRYLRLAKKFHPDKNPANDEQSKREIQEKFVSIQLAYEILSDPESKRLYDMTSNSQETYTKANFTKFSEAYKKAVNEVHVEAEALRKEAVTRREKWEQDLRDDVKKYEKQKEEFVIWRKGVVEYLEMLMKKLDQMENCQAKADILLSVQTKMKEMKLHVDAVVQKTLSTTSSRLGHTKTETKNRVSEYEKLKYQEDLQRYKTMKLKHEQLMKRSNLHRE